MNDVILVVAAHPDDEALGCGGTIAKYALEGAKIHVLFLADGVSARTGEQQAENFDARLEAAYAAANILGVTSVSSLGLPDNRLDSLPLLDITQCIETKIAELGPSTVLTHWDKDLNIDHQIAFRSVMTACRPLPSGPVCRIMSFEVLSSTEWSHHDTAFAPTYYESIDARHIEKKLLALEAYSKEMRSAPHPRSMEGVSHLARYRGYSAGLDYAEAFRVIRWIN